MSRPYKEWEWIGIGAMVGIGICVTSLVIGLFKEVPSSVPKPKSKVQTASHQWSKQDSLSYAKDQVMKDSQAQFNCLSNLWGKESGWRSKAYNPVKVMGRNAGGIPQILGMSPLTPPTDQIDRGLSYIYFRYQTICNAWAFWQRNHYY